MNLKIILTGATGYVGEGVLRVCLDHADVAQVLMVNRRPYPLWRLYRRLVPRITEGKLLKRMDSGEFVEINRGH